MKWISKFQLFLFDFDGLLVNTEELHFKAYIRMCAKRGFHLNWSFPRYSEAAHHHATGLRDQIYEEFPELCKQEPNWDVLYEEKKRAFLKILEEESVPLMPGVADLLQSLQEAGIQRCVVTHSPKSLVQLIRRQNPVLNTIPHWITREDYSLPKPHPECYQTAISRFAKDSGRVIGFEDTPRGLNALMQTQAVPVLVCPSSSSYIDELMDDRVHYYSSFGQINDQNHPL